MPSTIKQNHANNMQIQAKSCRAKIKQMSCHAKIVQNERKTVRNKLPGHTCRWRMRGPPKKTGPVKKEWQVGRDNDSRSRRPRTAAPGLARGLTRAGQHYYSHGPAASQQRLRLQPVPHPRGAQRLHPAAQRAEEARALPAGRRAPADQAGQGFFRDKYYEYLVYVPVIIRGRRRSGRNYERTPGAPHGGAGGAAGQAAGGGLAGPGRPHPAALGRDLLPRPRGALGGSAPRARATGTPGPRWRRSCASA